MSVPYTFATATSPIPLSQLDANFAVATGPNSNVQSATQGQTIFTVPVYYPGTNSLKVYIDGVKQIINSSYTETNSTTVTFSEGLHFGAIVEFTG